MSTVHLAIFSDFSLVIGRRTKTDNLLKLSFMVLRMILLIGWKVFDWVLICDKIWRIDFGLSFVMIIKRKLTWESHLICVCEIDKIRRSHLLMEFLWINAVIALFFGFDFDGHESKLRLTFIKKIASADFTAFLVLGFRDPFMDKNIILAIECDVVFGIKLLEELLRFESSWFF